MKVQTYNRLDWNMARVMKMKHFAAIIMMQCAWTGITAQTRLLFDSNWQFTRNGKTITVDLPHDWDIYEAPNPETGATGTGGG